MRFKNTIQEIETDRNKFNVFDKVKLILHFMEKKGITAMSASDLMERKYTPSKIHTALISNPTGNAAIVDDIFNAIIGKDANVTITKTIDFTTSQPL